MKNLILLSSFFMIAPLTLLLSISLLSYSLHKNNSQMGLLYSKKGPSYAALPPQDASYKDFVVASDSRTEIVKQFLTRYGSPLLPFAQNIVDAADKYSIDFRLIPAIAMQESNLCVKAPADSNNCWGFGIYGGKVKTFADYGQAIDTVSRGLGQNYVARGLDTPQEIMKVYTPSNDGAWAASVTHFMEQLR